MSINGIEVIRWPCRRHGRAAGEPCVVYELPDGGELVAVCGRDRKPRREALVELSDGSCTSAL